LRHQFRESPGAVAVALGVRPADVDAFAGLDADELDWQAAEIAQLRSLSRHRTMSSDENTQRATTTALDPELLEAGLCARLRQKADLEWLSCRLLTTTVAIGTPRGALALNTRAALQHLEAPSQTPDVLLEVTPADGSWIVFRERMPVKHCPREEEVVPALKQMLREIVTDRHRFFIKIHAAVVQVNSGCVLPRLGSGKSAAADRPERDAHFPEVAR
jgi:hypothetical protein